MDKVLTLEKGFLSQVHIKNGAGSSFTIEGIEIAKVDNDDYTLSFDTILRRLYTTDLLGYHMQKVYDEIRGSIDLDKDEALLKYILGYPRVGTSEVFINVVNELPNVYIDGATDRSDSKWHVLDCRKITKCVLKNARDITSVEFAWLDVKPKEPKEEVKEVKEVKVPLPAWLRDDTYKWITPSPSVPPMHECLEVVFKVLKSLGNPTLPNPPDEVLKGGYYGGSWTWIWGADETLSKEQPFRQKPYIKIVFDGVGRTEIEFSDGNSVIVAAKWGWGHKIKYNLMQLDHIKSVWELLSKHDFDGLNQYLLTIPKSDNEWWK